MTKHSRAAGRNAGQGLAALAPWGLVSMLRLRDRGATVGLDMGFPSSSMPAVAARLEGWCRAWPPVRIIPSTGQAYTVEALPYVGEPWLFRYRYAEEGA